MKVIICLDDNMGMMFGGRRQSRDRLLIADVLKNNSEVLISPYSELLFKEYKGQVKLLENPLAGAEKYETVFVENISLKEYADKIDELCIYFWNRSYPYDMVFDLDLNLFSLKESEDFKGSSHEKITKKIYIKNQRSLEI